MKRILASVALISLAGCAEWTHLTRTIDWSDQNSKAGTVLIDAKQRSITFSSDRYLAVCAEPSPDALSAIAASSSFGLSKKDKLDINTGLALSEAAGSIGLRTQSIQLMRDAMYRLCEGYISGAIDADAFETLHRRFQSSMVAILAIEQLTSAVRPPAVVLGEDAILGNAERVAELTTKTEEARAKVEQAEAAVKNRTTEYDTAKKAHEGLENEKKTIEAKKEADRTETEKARITKLPEEIKADSDTEGTKLAALNDAKTSLTNEQSVFTEFDKARKAQLVGGGSAKSVITLETPSGNRMSDTAATQIAKAVTDIVKETLGLSFGRELCTTVLLKHPTFEPPPKDHHSTVERCVEYLNASTVNLTKDMEIRASVAGTQAATELKNAETFNYLITHLKPEDLSKALSNPAILDQLMKSQQKREDHPPVFLN